VSFGQGSSPLLKVEMSRLKKKIGIYIREIKLSGTATMKSPKSSNPNRQKRNRREKRSQGWLEEGSEVKGKHLEGENA